MNWVELVWHAMAGANLLLSGVYLVVWLHRRRDFEYLSLFLAAASLTVLALLEPLSLQARSIEEFAFWVRWFHVPAAVLLISLVVFVRLRYRAGSLWLGGLSIALRIAAVAGNFLTGDNLNFLQVTALTPIQVGGATVMAPTGVANPWMVLGQLSILFMACFVLQAVVQIVRREPAPQRFRGVAILLGAAFFLFAAGLWSALVVTGVVHAPFVVVPCFVTVVLALAYDLGTQLPLVPQLGRDLAGSEADRRLRELELELVDRDSGLGVWNWDCHSDEVGCSDRALELMDFEPGKPFNRDEFRERVAPEYRETVGRDFLATTPASGEYYKELRIELRSGGARWLTVIGHLQRDDSGAPLRLHGILLDHTSQRQASDRFRRVVQAAPMAMLIVEPDGRIVFANGRAEGVFGYTRSEMSGLGVDDLVPEKWRQSHRSDRERYAADAVRRDMAATREVLGRRKDGSEVALEIILSPMPSETGSPQVLAMISDISARKASEREASERRNELAHLSRVAMLAELSGSLAHELNQPLTAILSNAQASARFLGRDPPDIDEVRDSLRNIIESDKRAGEVIRRLRAMLRNEPPDFQLLDIGEVVADVLHILHSDLIQRNVEIRLELHPALPRTKGDKIQLQQVLLNLIMNGCDAMSDATDRSVLTIRTQALSANLIELQVRDVGSGIPEQDLEKIFAPFVTSKSSGMGLGLAVCTTIVQMHNGRIWAENNVGGPGATFHLELPAANAPAPA